MKKIEGLENMTCNQIIEALTRVLDQAEKDADVLDEEIMNSYEERDKAEKEMHQAAEKKDLKAYKEARFKYDMLIEWIAKKESERDNLISGSLIDPDDNNKIIQRMFHDCDLATRNAAVRINDMLQEITEVYQAAMAEINRHNAVLLKLNECTRPKDRYEKDIPATIYRDIIIGPYLQAINGVQDNRTAAFKVFIKNITGQ